MTEQTVWSRKNFIRKLRIPEEDEEEFRAERHL